MVSGLYVKDCLHMVVVAVIAISLGCFAVLLQPCIPILSTSCSRLQA
jgi:hypothetical protein